MKGTFEELYLEPDTPGVETFNVTGSSPRMATYHWQCTLSLHNVTQCTRVTWHMSYLSPCTGRRHMDPPIGFHLAADSTTMCPFGSGRESTTTICRDWYHYLRPYWG